MIQTNIPTLRFPEFDGEWEKKKLGKVTEYVKGYAFKSDYYKNEGVRIIRVSDLGARDIKQDNEKIFINKEVASEYDKYILRKGDIIITTVGSKPELLDSAVGRGIFINKEDEGLLNQNMLKFNKSKNVENGFLFGYINSQKYVAHIKEIQRGNANQSNITVVDLLNYEISLPSLSEQTKIANFLTAVDDKLTQLKKKKTLLEQYKKGVMQQIFSQQLRFKQDDGSDFEAWEEKKLGEILVEHKTRNSSKNIEEVFSVAKNKGVINQIEHLGRSYASDDTSNYKVVYPNDIIYTKSPTSDFPFGIIKQNKLDRVGIVSVLYGVFTPINKNIGLLLDYYFSNWQNTFNYLNPLVQKGAKNTMNISNDTFLNGAELPLPSSELEQTKIANFLSAIDDMINQCGQQEEKMGMWKKGLLQQMFV